MPVGAVSNVCCFPPNPQVNVAGYRPTPPVPICSWLLLMCSQLTSQSRNELLPHRWVGERECVSRSLYRRVLDSPGGEFGDNGQKFDSWSQRSVEVFAAVVGIWDSFNDFLINKSGEAIGQDIGGYGFIFNEFAEVRFASQQHVPKNEKRPPWATTRPTSRR